MLVIIGQKWVIMCPHVVHAKITITMCTSKLYLNMNTQEARIPSVSPHTPVSIHSYLTASAYACLLHVRIADCIKNREPYQCLSLTRVFLASKTPLLIADHLRATFINRSTCQVYIETLKMPLTHKQAKSGGQTDR